MQLLARFRVALGWVFAPLVLIASVPTSGSLVVGGAIAIAGEAIRIWAAGHLNKAREVTASGPYRWFAHPLYVGSSVIGVGLSVASASPIAAALVVLYLVVTLKAAVRNEEAFLRRAFGDQYDLYRRNVAAARASRDVRARRFSLTQAMTVNREYRAVVGLLGALLLLALKATYNGSFWATAGRLAQW